jgi:methionine-rich copper-binding protein CopC
MFKFVFAAGIALVAIVAFANGAFAHSRPVRFDPAPGAVLQAAPSKIDGWFTAAIRRDPNWSFIRVTDAQGNRVDSGDAALSSDRLQMSVNLKSGLAPGRYLVTWRTWDDGDGAIFGDCFAFFVGQAAADQAASGKTRLDGGGSCERIDVSAKNGTPVPGSTPATSSADSADDDRPSSASSGGSKVPWWTLVIGIGGGLVVGVIGGRLVKMGS